MVFQDEKRVMVAGNSGPGFSGPAQPVLPPVWDVDTDVLRTEAEEFTRPETSARVGWMSDEARGEGVVFDRETGALWFRQQGLSWRLVAEQQVPAWREVARLMVDPGSTGAELVAPIRDRVTTSGPTLNQAKAYARGTLRVDVGQARAGYDLAHAELAATEDRPHLIVMVVDDLELLVGSCNADADMEPSGPVKLTYRYEAVCAVRRGAGRHVFSRQYATRFAVLDDLLAMLIRRRPGQRFEVVPV